MPISISLVAPKDTNDFLEIEAKGAGAVGKKPISEVDYAASGEKNMVVEDSEEESKSWAKIVATGKGNAAQKPKENEGTEDSQQAPIEASGLRKGEVVPSPTRATSPALLTASHEKWLGRSQSGIGEEASSPSLGITEPDPVNLIIYGDEEAVEEGNESNTEKGEGNKDDSSFTSEEEERSIPQERLKM
ncbi:hypothetical protein U1Q18_009909 [Sarracenia purpurea var. burkii]